MNFKLKISDRLIFTTLLKLKVAVFVVIIFGLFLPLYSAFAVNLTANCFVDPLSINVGERARWTVVSSGGTGVYQYSWIGTDNLFGTVASIFKVYNSEGEKTANVTVTSGGQSVTPTCTLEVVEKPDILSATCFTQSSIVPISEPVSWSTESSGGSGRLQYFWIGDDDLSGSGKNVNKEYETTGVKSATVTVSSGSQSTTRTCSVLVIADPPLSGQCFPDYTFITTGNPITWTAKVSGGTGEYRYLWSGTDDLKGSKQAVSNIYERVGQKTANVTITSGEQSITRSCHANVGSVLGSSTQAPSSESSSLVSSCFVSPNYVEIGEQATWTAVASGGTGSYRYLWNGTDNLSGSTQSVSKAYNSTGFKTAVVSVFSDGESSSSACTIQVFEKGDSPPAGTFIPPPSYPPSGGVVLGQLPYTGIDSESGMKLISFFFLIVVSSVLVSFILILRKREKEQRKAFAFAYEKGSGENGDGGENKNIADIVQAEAGKYEVLISASALKELIDNSDGNVSASISNLRRIISGLKKLPEPISYGEERLPVIDEAQVEDYFLKNKD